MAVIFVGMTGFINAKQIIIIKQVNIMWQKIILIFMALIISGCSDWRLKRSANNKIFDTKGFEGGKRRPLYNKKYISKAQINVRDYNYDEDEIEEDNDEIIDPATMNRAMYREMLEKDRARKRKPRRASGMDYDDDYPRLADAKRSSLRADDKSEAQMQQELKEIKKMLANTQKDMAKYRCPMQQQADAERAKKARTASQRENDSKRTHSISSSIGVDD